MVKTLRTPFSALMFALGVGLAGAPATIAGPESAPGPHGGTVETTPHYRFEVLTTPTGLKVYPSGLAGKPLNASSFSGSATFYHPNSPKPWFDRPLEAEPADASLGRNIDLSKVPAQGAKVAFQIAGLPDPAEPTASFTVPFTQPQVPTAFPPAPAPPAALPLSVSRATQADQPAINAQRVCAVRGTALGSMGAPIKVSRGGRSVFLCCQGCVKSVQADPDRYLGPVR